MEDTGRGLKPAAGGKRLCQGSAQGSSGCAQKHCGDALSAHQCLVLIQEKGDQKEYGKVQKARPQRNFLFPICLPMINPANTDAAT